MKANRNVLIITDGFEETVKMAGEIATALKGNTVLVKSASEFKGNDLLPADVFFLGCESPKPDSFEYLADLLAHINLAGRSCGVFSPAGVKTVNYLAGLVKDCEAALNPEPFLSDSAINVSIWAQSVVAGGRH